MKKIILLLSLTLSISAFAQRQSMFIFVGAFEILFEKIFKGQDVPKKNYSIDYQNQELMELLKTYSVNRDTRLPNQESTFSFANTHEDLDSTYKKDMGVCRGYSSLRRKIRFLGLFDKDNLSQIEIPNPSTKKGERKYKRFYKKIIKDIRNYKARIIPGFANLYEMSQDPIIGKMLKWQVLHEWRDKNFSPGTGTGAMIKGVFKHSTYEELVNMQKRIKANIELNHNTMIWLSQKHSSWIHALEAIDTTEIAEDGSFTITFWNDKFTDVSKATSKMTITKDAKIIYDDSIEQRELNAAGVVKDNDAEMVFLAEKHKKFCQNNPTFCVKNEEIELLEQKTTLTEEQKQLSLEGDHLISTEENLELLRQE